MERIWIYMSNRRLTDAEVNEINKDLLGFMAVWNAHGNKLDTSFEILYNYFIIIKANEERVLASGCSIDSSVQFMAELAKKHNLDLFDRQQVAWLDYKNEVNTTTLNKLTQLYKDRILTDNTIIFNNTLQSGEELPLKWKLPLKDSLYTRFLS